MDVYKINIENVLNYLIDFDYLMEQQLTKFEEAINNYEIKDVNLNSILGLKKLTDDITKFEKLMLWKSFSPGYDVIIQKFEKLNIPVDSSIKDFKEYPKNIILIMKETICSALRVESNEEKTNELKKLNVDLTREYIEQEDLQDEIQEKTYYLFCTIDNKFEWLDDNEDFNKISELLEKISKEICNGVVNFIEKKRQFYSDYFEESYKKENKEDKPIGFNSKIYVNNFIKSYLLSHFNDVFNQACLDVLDQNNIKDEEQIKQIISLYYDYTKASTKLMLSLTDIDHRINSAEKLLNSDS